MTRRAVFHGVLLLLAVALAQGGAAFAQSFIENQGQTNEAVRLYFEGARASAYFTPGALVLDLREPAHPLQSDPLLDPESPAADADDTPRRACALRLTFAGADPAARVEGIGPLPTRFNFFRGKDPAAWRTDVPAYDAVAYRDLWPGIDLVFRIEDGALIYEVEAAAGANPAQVEFLCAGANEIRAESSGRIIIDTPVGSVAHQRPTAADARGQLSWADATVESVSGELRDDADDLLWSTFLGGSIHDWGYGVALRGGTTPVVLGLTESYNFPTGTGGYDISYNGDKDVFVAQINSLGTLLTWGTYLGGANDDAAYDLDLDVSENIVLAGNTQSPDFPVTPSAFDNTLGSDGMDAFVAKLSSDGSTLLWATYLGTNYGGDNAGSVVVDGSGNPIVVGVTGVSGFPSSFPVTAGAYDTSHNGGDDTFVTKLNATGTALVWSTFLGGSGDEGSHNFGMGLCIELDAAGNPVVGSTTASSDFPTTAGAYDRTHNGSDDAYVAKLNASGSALLWSTFLGGAGHDWVRELALDRWDDPVVTGETYSTGYPTTPNAFDSERQGVGPDAFVTKLSSSGSSLLASSLLGGWDTDNARTLAVDRSGDMIIAGYTEGDFPLTANAYDTSHNGGQDAFLAVLSPTAESLVWSTYLGGSNHDQAHALAMDIQKHAIVVGHTYSSDFPTTPGAYDRTWKENDIFVSRFDLDWAISVCPDDTGDFATIQMGLNNSTDGDIVELCDGTYTGALNRDLDFGGRAVTLRSASGNAAACIIDCEGNSSTPHRGFYFHTGEGNGSIVENITVTGGYHAGGGAVYCDGTSPAFNGCVLTGNATSSGADGGAITSANGGMPVFTACQILDNQAADDGGALQCRDGGGAVLNECILAGNSAGDAGGAIYLTVAGTASLTNTTVADNQAPGVGAVASVRESCVLTVDRSILAYNGNGQAIHCLNGTATLSCSDVYGNTGGDWVGCIAAQGGTSGNLSADPAFCDRPNGDYTIARASACADAPGCGLIGALEPACGVMTLRVCPDASGDYLTIQEAIDAAWEGDTIELCDGTYTGPGNRDLDLLGKQITVRSESGQAEACMIDCQGSAGEPHRGFNIHSGEDDAIIEDLTITGGCHAGGGAVLCDGASPTFNGCRFTGNSTTSANDGGALQCMDGATPAFNACLFSDNHAADDGGALQCRDGGYADLNDCLLHGNTAGDSGGAIYLTTEGGAVLSGCTVADNQAPGLGAAASVREGCVFTVDRTIIAFNGSGVAVHCQSGSATLSCCDVHGNAGGDWVGCLAGQDLLRDNFSANPRFCDLPGGDFTLAATSPCAAENNPACGQVGAFGVGCPGAPEIRVEPSSLSFLLPPGGTQCIGLTIHNDGSGDLLWSLVEESGALLALRGAAPAGSDSRQGTSGETTPVVSQTAEQSGTPATAASMAPGLQGNDDEPAHGEPDGWSGAPVTRGLGGPDAFGHTWIDSDSPTGPDFEWIDIRSVGTEVVLDMDDYEEVSLPFPFPFYGVEKTSVKICSHAYLTFGIDGIDYSNDPIPNSTNPDDLIALFWDDISSGGGGTVHYFDDAVENRFIVQYTDLERFGGTESYTMEAILHPDGRIILQYLHMTDVLTLATIGIENAVGDVGLQVVANAAYVHDNLAIRIEDAVPWLAESPLAGTVAPSSSAVVEVCADADLAPGVYTCTLLVSSNDAAEPLVEIPVSLEISAHDVLGLYTENDGTGGDRLIVAPNTTFEIYLTLSGASRPEGIGAWEARLTVSPNITIDSWTYQGSGVPIGGFPGDFACGLYPALPWQSVIWLGTIRAVITDDEPGYFYLAPHEPSSIDPPAPCYAPGGTTDLVAMLIASGSEEIPVFVVNGDPTAVQPPVAPQEFALRRCFPNPFGPSTAIEFDLPRATPVHLRVYDAGGRLVRTLADGELYPAGRHLTRWDGADDGGRRAGSGMYFYRIDAGTFHTVRKVTFLK